MSKYGSHSGQRIEKMEIYMKFKCVIVIFLAIKIFAWHRFFTLQDSQVINLYLDNCNIPTDGIFVVSIVYQNIAFTYSSVKQSTVLLPFYLPTHSNFPRAHLPKDEKIWVERNENEQPLTWPTFHHRLNRVKTKICNKYSTLLIWWWWWR